MGLKAAGYWMSSKPQLEMPLQMALTVSSWRPGYGSEVPRARKTCTSWQGAWRSSSAAGAARTRGAARRRAEGKSILAADG